MPDTKTEIRSLKRKVDQIWDEGIPTTTSHYLRWRLAAVESELQVAAKQKQALTEASESVDEAGTRKSDLMAAVKEDEKTLLAEKAFLLSQRKTLDQDLSDVVTSVEQLEDAYIHELRVALDLASSSKDKLPGLKAPKLNRQAFPKVVHQYLGTHDKADADPELKWCNIMGLWLHGSDVKCAHIVPYSWSNKDLAHMFGSDEPPLTSRRNGLSLQKKLEEAFDNCWIAIVPDGSIEPTPTQWKVVLLNPVIKKNTFWRDTFNISDQKDWRFEDIDGRKLSFVNDNRPARRFLYMRYALAWMHARDKSWPGFQEKLPSREIWASPNKPDGYLRKSILLAMGKRIGDTLPQELISAGAFEDPDTSSVVLDEVAGIRVGDDVQNYLDGARDPKIREESTDQSEDENADPDEEATTG
jgi:hypothetical protein